MSYKTALEASGCVVHEYITTGDYQGTWYALVEYNGKVGVVSGSYGSCSGCDAFEAEFGWDEQDKLDPVKVSQFTKSYLDSLRTTDEVINENDKNKDDVDYEEFKQSLEKMKEIESRISFKKEVDKVIH
jgi:hypothetical protein